MQTVKMPNLVLDLLGTWSDKAEPKEASRPWRQRNSAASSSEWCPQNFVPVWRHRNLKGHCGRATSESAAESATHFRREGTVGGPKRPEHHGWHFWHFGGCWRHKSS